MFPYPDNVLTPEQRDDLRAFVESSSKTFAEVIDPAKNDETESVPEGTLQALREAGAFGLQVSSQFQIAKLNLNFKH